MSRLTAHGTVVASTTVSAVLALCLMGGLGAEAPPAASSTSGAGNAVDLSSTSASVDLVSAIDEGIANGTRAGAFFGAGGGVAKSLDSGPATSSLPELTGLSGGSLAFDSLRESALDSTPESALVSPLAAVPESAAFIAGQLSALQTAAVATAGVPTAGVQTAGVQAAALHTGAVQVRVSSKAVAVTPVSHLVVHVTAASPPRQIAQSLAAVRGWTGVQWTCLSDLWQRESMFRTTARNGRSGAYGIPQAYPASKMATAGADWRTDPITQVTWGLGYIAKRYGNPCNAWAYWRRHRSY